jgi:hypothetical protein
MPFHRLKATMLTCGRNITELAGNILNTRRSQHSFSLSDVSWTVLYFNDVDPNSSLNQVRSRLGTELLDVTFAATNGKNDGKAK